MYCRCSSKHPDSLWTYQSVRIAKLHVSRSRYATKSPTAARYSSTRYSLVAGSRASDRCNRAELLSVCRGLRCCPGTSERSGRRGSSCSRWGCLFSHSLAFTCPSFRRVGLFARNGHLNFNNTNDHLNSNNNDGDNNNNVNNSGCTHIARRVALRRL